MVAARVLRRARETRVSFHWDDPEAAFRVQPLVDVVLDENSAPVELTVELVADEPGSSEARFFVTGGGPRSELTIPIQLYGER